MTCPCGTGLDYEQCCAPYLAGDKPAPSALALMRSRYCAYVRCDVDYITATQEGDDADREATEKWARESEWLGLEIVKTEGGEAGDDTGTVEFIARYKHLGEEFAHHEQAEFRRAGDRWTLVDGKLCNSTFRRTEAKVKPNQPCPCGSGVKYKKCCGKR